MVTPAGTKIGVNSYDMTQTQIFRNEVNKIEKPGTLAHSDIAVVEYLEGQVLCQDPNDPDAEYMKYVSPIVLVNPSPLKGNETKGAAGINNGGSSPYQESIGYGDGVTVVTPFICSKYNLKPGTLVVEATYTPGGSLTAKQQKAADKASAKEGAIQADPPITMILTDDGNGHLMGQYGGGVIDYENGEGTITWAYPPDGGGGAITQALLPKPDRKTGNSFVQRALIVGDILGSYSYFENTAPGAENPCAINKTTVSTPAAGTSLNAMVFTSGNFRAPKLIPADIWTADDYARLKLAEHDIILHNM